MVRVAFISLVVGSTPPPHRPIAITIQCKYQFFQTHAVLITAVFKHMTVFYSVAGLIVSYKLHLAAKIFPTKLDSKSKLK